MSSVIAWTSCLIIFWRASWQRVDVGIPWTWDSPRENITERQVWPHNIGKQWLVQETLPSPMSVVDVLCGMLCHLLEPHILMVAKQFYKIRLPEVSEHVTVLMAVYNKSPFSSIHHNYKQHITLLLWGLEWSLMEFRGLFSDQYL